MLTHLELEYEIGTIQKWNEFNVDHFSATFELNQAPLILQDPFGKQA